MNIFFTALAGNLVLSKGPQDYPYSIILMRLCLLVYFLTGLPGLLKSEALGVSLVVMALDTLVLLGFAYLCLQAFHKLPRFAQTISALASTGAVFQLAVLPLMQSLNVEDVQAAAPEAMLGFTLLLLLFVIWNLAVYAHIFRESFNIRLPAAMVLTVCYVIINVLVRTLFFPELGGPAN